MKEKDKMEKKPTCSIHQLTTESLIIVLDSFEQTKEELNLQFSELMELLGNNVNTHVEFKVNELIRLSMGLGFAQGMRFEHYVERFMDPLQESKHRIPF